jgi:hypothetical protein
LVAASALTLLVINIIAIAAIFISLSRSFSQFPLKPDQARDQAESATEGE